MHGFSTQLYSASSCTKSDQIYPPLCCHEQMLMKPDGNIESIHFYAELRPEKLLALTILLILKNI